jgi:hypothetical protein
MPYIDPGKRALARKLPITPGELNFAITKCLIEYMLFCIDDRGKLTYQIINDILGALEGAKLEFTRRVVNPFEDEALRQNGDIYGKDK